MPRGEKKKKEIEAYEQFAKEHKGKELSAKEIVDGVTAILGYPPTCRKSPLDFEIEELTKRPDPAVKELFEIRGYNRHYVL